jgi:hypothetical protein
MSSGIYTVPSRRVWFVEGFLVWGLPGLGESEFLVSEAHNGVTSVLFGGATVGGPSQEVLFSQLSDHRGNVLPSAIDNPRIILRPKEPHTAFIVGKESESSFIIARDPTAAGPVTVDMLIVELHG